MMQDGEQIDGIVSLWVGHADSESALATYADCDDPAHAPATLATDFGTGWYDHDFMDIAVEAPTQSLSTLLRGCSYESIIIPKFIELCGERLSEESNAFVLLYNFRHNGNRGVTSLSTRPVCLRYMGSISVEMPWPE